jgi:NAD(P)-dependent dehydrogenase (short-subunit alcohol dehydrogenase family)
MSLSFNGRVALVTGAGDGLGRAYARYLAQRGARVVVNDYGVDAAGASRAKAVAQELRELGGEAVADIGSVADEPAAAAMVQRAIDAFGRIDILINNAGSSVAGPLWERSTEDMRRVHDVHLMGSFWTMRAALPHMRGQDYGRIVNTASALGAFGIGNSSPYCSAKAAVIGLTRSAAQEHPGLDIRINAVAPIAFTALATRFFDANPQIDRAAFTLDKVTPVIAYLSHESCRLNGQILSVAAGRVARIFAATAPGWNPGVPEDDAVDAALPQILSTDGYLIPDTVMDEFRFFGA